MFAKTKFFGLISQNKCRKVSTIAAMCFRHRMGRTYNQPNPKLSYTENFLYMIDSYNEVDYKPNPKLARALDM